MKRTDLHTHSSFSNDGKATLAEMVSEAQRQGLAYFGASEHFDTDSVTGKIFSIAQIPEYFAAARALQEETRGGEFTFLAGGEFGFSPKREAQEGLLSVFERFSPDFIVNSVHIVDGCDCYFSDYFAGKTKKAAYSAYLSAVRQSLDALYPYQIVGHIGYVSRNAPYPDRKIRYEEFADLYDDILKTIVLKGKILEVNSSAYGAGSDFLPDEDVLSRYFALGGRLISFGSDAHEPSRISHGRDAVLSALKRVGFRSLAVPVRGKTVFCPLS